MKKTIITLLSATVLLTACASAPPTTGLAKPVQVPPLPYELSRKADRLPDLTDTTFGGCIKDGAATDQQYNAVAFQLNNIIDLYTCVRKSVNDGTDPQESCLSLDKKPK